jgi:excisionase family DNA binding protein
MGWQAATGIAVVMTASSGQSLAKRVSRAKTLDGGAPAAVSLMEAAARLRIGRSTMQKLVRERKVRSFKIGRALRIPVKSIEELIVKLEKERIKL